MSPVPTSPCTLSALIFMSNVWSPPCRVPTMPENVGGSVNHTQADTVNDGMSKSDEYGTDT